MDLKEKLNNYAIGKGWGFKHARRDYLNLHDAFNFVADTVKGYGQGETVLLLDPITSEPNLKDNTLTYSGNMLILTNSDFKETYEEKYNLYLQPLKVIVEQQMPAALNCEFDVQSWKITEVVNMFDFNADGFNISFNLKSY